VVILKAILSCLKILAIKEPQSTIQDAKATKIGHKHDKSLHANHITAILWCAEF